MPQPLVVLVQEERVFRRNGTRSYEEEKETGHKRKGLWSVMEHDFGARATIFRQDSLFLVRDGSSVQQGKSGVSRAVHLSGCRC